MVTIRAVEPKDKKAICELYNYYVLHTTHTFEMTPTTEEKTRQKIKDVTQDYPFLVNKDGVLVGCAYFNPYHSRCAYSHVAETSIYMDTSYQGQGIGSHLYKALLEQAPTCDISEVIAVVAMPNVASERLHKNLGFRHVGTFTDMGYKLEQWVDTSYWQLSLPKASL